MTHSRRPFLASINWSFVARLLLALFLGAAAAWAMMSISGCAASTNIRPATTSLERTTTVYDANGKPKRSETVSGSASGPSISSDSAKALELDSQTPTLDLPGACEDGSTLSAGSGRSSVSGTFGKAAPVWGLWMIGLALCGAGGFVAVKFAKITLGATMIGAGAFIVAGTFYPLLWIGAAVCALGYVAWTVWEAHKGDQKDTALISIVGGVQKLDQQATVQKPDGTTTTVTVNPAKEKIQMAAVGVEKTVDSVVDWAKSKIKK